jgi:hypothetical protein
MSSRFAEEIKHANGFGNKIEELVLTRGQAPTGDRNTLLMAYWSLVFEFQRGVLCLTEHRFYGAAFALVRPIVETVVRLVQLESSEDLGKIGYSSAFQSTTP